MGENVVQNGLKPQNTEDIDFEDHISNNLSHCLHPNCDYVCLNFKGRVSMGFELSLTPWTFNLLFTITSFARTKTSTRL